MKPFEFLIAFLFLVLPVCNVFAYRHLSPYAYCAGDPINSVDIDGKDIYYYDQNGNLFRTQEDKDVDQVNCVDANNNFVMGVEYASGTITLQSIAGISCLRVNGDKEGCDIFTFLADNTTVEWSQAKTKDPVGPGQSNFISTGNKTNYESTGFTIAINLLKNGYDVKEQNHNHPSGTLNPSGFLDGFSNTTREYSAAGTYGDAGFASSIAKYIPTISLNIYSNGQYQQYDSKGKVGMPYVFVNLGNLNLRITNIGR